MAETKKRKEVIQWIKETGLISLKTELKDFQEHGFITGLIATCEMLVSALEELPLDIIRKFYCGSCKVSMHSYEVGIITDWIGKGIHWFCGYGYTECTNPQGFYVTEEITDS